MNLQQADQSQMNGWSDQFSQQQGTLSSLTNCIQTWPSYQTHYVYADVMVDRAANGFVITIAGKKYVATDTNGVATVITEYLK